MDCEPQQQNAFYFYFISEIVKFNASVARDVVYVLSSLSNDDHSMMRVSENRFRMSQKVDQKDRATTRLSFGKIENY